MGQHTGDPTYVFVAEHWQIALDAAGDALDALREIYPDYCWHVRVETANNAIDSAIGRLQGTVADLHRAGRHVLGTEQYDDFMQDRADRRLVDIPERGDI